MRHRRTVNLLLNALDEYQRILSSIESACFTVTYDNLGSYAQLYTHIVRANLRALLAIQKCVQRRTLVRRKGITMLGWLVLCSRRFPPQKNDPVSVSTIVKAKQQDIRNELLTLRRRILELVPEIDKSSPSFRVKHPRLGMLNARQWLRFMQIHTCHHLKQLRLIQAAAGKR